MNPTIIKALIISGGTIGLGAPGVYYSYPHIYNLINPKNKEDQSPSVSEDQKPPEKAESIRLSEGGAGETPEKEPESTLNTKEQKESISSTDVVDNFPPTNSQGQKNAGSDNTKQGNNEESVSNQGDNNKSASGNTPQGNPTQTTTELGSSPQKNQNS